jgi:hypothetical protein
VLAHSQQWDSSARTEPAALSRKSRRSCRAGLTVDGHLRHAEQTVAWLSEAAELPREQRTALHAAARQRVDEVNEASLCDTDELKWAGVGHLIVRPRLAARLGLALWAEVKHSLPRLSGSYDTALFSNARLVPVEPRPSQVH